MTQTTALQSTPSTRDGYLLDVCSACFSARQPAFNVVVTWQVCFGSCSVGKPVFMFEGERKKERERIWLSMENQPEGKR